MRHIAVGEGELLGHRLACSGKPWEEYGPGSQACWSRPCLSKCDWGTSSMDPTAGTLSLSLNVSHPQVCRWKFEECCSKPVSFKIVTILPSPQLGKLGSVLVPQVLVCKDLVLPVDQQHPLYLGACQLWKLQPQPRMGSCTFWEWGPVL